MNNKPRLLIINQSPVSYFKDIIFDLRELNEVSLMCGDIDNYFPNDIKYIFSKTYNRNSLINRSYSWFLFFLHAFYYLLFNNYKYEKVLIVSNPPFVIWLSLICPKKVRILLFDIYPNILEQISSNNIAVNLILRLIIFLWKSLNFFIYKSIIKIFTISNKMAEKIYYSSILNPNLKDKIVVVYPWSNIFSDKDKDKDKIFKFRKNFLHDSRLLIIYSGNMGLTHPLEFLVNSSSKIKDYAKVVLIGKGAKRKKLEAITKKISINQTLFLDPFPFEEISLCISCADLCVVCIDGPSSQYSLPSKLFTALNCGKPILAIAPNNSELSNIVKKYKCGFVIPPNNLFEKEFCLLIKDLYQSPDKLKIFSNNAKKASKLFSKENSLNLIRNL